MPRPSKTTMTLQKKRVAFWDHHSSGGTKVYRTFLYADGSTSCDCFGWTYLRAGETERSCKHTKSIQVCKLSILNGEARPELWGGHTLAEPPLNRPSAQPTYDFTQEMADQEQAWRDHLAMQEAATNSMRSRIEDLQNQLSGASTPEDVEAILRPAVERLQALVTGPPVPEPSPVQRFGQPRRPRKPKPEPVPEQPAKRRYKL